MFGWSSSILSLLLCASFSSIFACNCGDSGPLPATDPFDPLGPWHQRHLDCGIPPFAYRLPQDAQAKIHAIWVKYQAGDECEDEQEQTRAIIMAIPEEVRMQLFKGVCGPGFLKNETDEVRDRFRQAWFNEEMNIEAKQSEFRKLAQELLKGEAMARFEKFDQKLGEHIHERQQTIQQLSPPAREAYTKWVGMRKQERSFLTSLPADIRVELGLMCKCCGTCKTGQKQEQKQAAAATTPKSRAARSAAAAIDGDQLAKGLAMSDANALMLAAGIVCH